MDHTTRTIETYDQIANDYHVIATPESDVIRDSTGCGIASIAALAGKSYATVKRAAARLGIAVGDVWLWSETELVGQPIGRLRRQHRSGGRTRG